MALTALILLVVPRAGSLLSLFRSSAGGPGLVVVGLDGADWNIIDPLLARGEMPHLARLIERGTRARLLSFQPMLSPVLWTTIATGVRPERHGILDFVAIHTETGEVTPVTSNLRKAPAFWSLMSASGWDVGVTAWWATFPAEPVRGFMVSDRIAYQLFGVQPDDDPAGKTHPPEIFDDVRRLVVAPEEIGEERLSAYLGAAGPGEASAEERDILSQLRALVASGETYRRIAHEMSKRFRPDVEVVYFQPTDTVAHLTMRFRPPMMAGVDSALVERFGPALDEAYREADRLLGETVLRAGAGANIVVCSDHGFRSGANRPTSTDSRIDRGKAADWHRKYGILVLAGPAVKRGGEITDASLLDIAPTLLALLGEPVPDSLQGRVLVEALDEAFLREHPVRSGALPVATAGDGEGVAVASDDEAVLEKLVSLGYLSRESLNARNNRGILLMNRGEFDRAIAEFRAALDTQPDQPGVLVNLGRCQWLAGDVDGGMATLRRALQIDPRSKEAENLLGNMALDRGDFAEAERRFRRALEIEPDDPDTHNSLGILFETQERWQDAISAYRRVIEVDPDYAEGYNNIGNIQKLLGRLSEAEAWYRRAIDADPAFAGSYNNLALMLQDRGDLDGAEELYRRALRLNPDEPRTRNNLGSLHFLRGDLDRAREEFEEAARLDPDYAEARNSLGAVHAALGETGEAEKAYREALALNPDYPDALFNLGILLVGQGRTEEGRVHLERAVLVGKEHVPALVALSGLEAGGGDYGRAAELARRAVEARPRGGAAHLALGRAMAGQGRTGPARQHLLEALEIDPSLQEARRILERLEPAPGADPR